MPLAVVTIPNGRWKENCYLVVDGSAHALVIDPGSDAAQIVTAIEKVGLRVLAVLNTHGHYDHMGAVVPLQTRFSIPFYLHSADEKILKGANLYMKFFEGSEPVLIPRVDRYLDREELPIVIGDFEVQVRFTPGHTPGSVCFGIQEVLFTGDTLLKGKVGRVDLPGGDKDALRKSLVGLGKINPEMRIYPGHGAPSIIGDELQSNPQWRELLAA
ncbi:MAG: MBL fold metallo-hydrolase [Anaerolineaceae bacterium]|jgi:glyoxylase-like metal-dependent hydrolase (beta-lactamase superfamily II)